jgi:basic amino acid/polyamine antiporter, APA family
MKLRKELTLFSVYCIATGAMISSGLFILPGLAHSKAGPAVVFAYLIAGILIIPGMLSQAELVSAMPKAGGTYFYVTRSMGSAAGTVDGIITWFSMTLKSAFALVGMAAFTGMYLEIDIRLLGVMLTIVFVILNIIGVKEAGKLQIILVSGLLVILFFYVVKGIPHIDIRNFEPFAPNGFLAVLSTTGYVFISYGGLLKVASIAEETKNPSRTVPLAMIFSLITVILLYVSVVFITSGVLSDDVLNQSMTPISDGAFAIMGRPGALILGIAAMLAFISTANAGIMAASRYPLALARDHMLPSRLGKISERYGTPITAIVFTGAIITIFLFMKLDFLVKAASTVLILTFIFSCMSVIIMRESGVQNYQPKFIAPLYPWLQISGIMFYIFLIFEMGREAVISGITLVTCGLFIYWFYGKVRSSKEYALLHLIERITAKELTTRNLEDELKEIIRDRDGIIGDKFDTIIENCLVLDIPDPIDLNQFFEMSSEKLAPRIGIDKEKILTLLNKREEENSTIIAPGLAIPHIIVEGENKFDILLVRCKPGIVFSEKFENIDTVFILAGTKDERNFHLRALSAIAQIIHDHAFRPKWLAASDIEDLRDVILLGRRKRL